MWRQLALVRVGVFVLLFSGEIVGRELSLLAVLMHSFTLVLVRSVRGDKRNELLLVEVLLLRLDS